MCTRVYFYAPCNSADSFALFPFLNFTHRCLHCRDAHVSQRDRSAGHARRHWHHEPAGHHCRTSFFSVFFFSFFSSLFLFFDYIFVFVHSLRAHSTSTRASTNNNTHTHTHAYAHMLMFLICSVHAGHSLQPDPGHELCAGHDERLALAVCRPRHPCRAAGPGACVDSGEPAVAADGEAGCGPGQGSEWLLNNIFSLLFCCLFVVFCYCIKVLFFKRNYCGVTLLRC